MTTTAPSPAARPPAGAPAAQRVLVLPGGTEIGLEVRAALAGRRDVELFSAGIDAPGHAPYAFRHHDVLPDLRGDGWLDPLNDLVRRRGIDMVLPAHDDAVLALAEHAGEVAARVVSSPAATCRIARSKRATYAALADVVRVPRVVDDPAAAAFPLFVKPDRGQGSAGARVVRDRAELERALRDGSDLVMEVLPGDEHTVDCFSDRERGLLFAAPRRRVATRAGISMRSVPVEDPDLMAMAHAIAGRLELHGAWFFQARRDAAGAHRLLEVAPRIAGTSALTRAMGVNLPLLSVYEALRVPLEVAPNGLRVEIDRALVNRYRHDLRYSAVYVDLDDTLVVRGRVQARLVALLYRSIDEGRRVVLLTRHRGDLAATLRRHRLSELFDEVVRVADDEEKADHVREPDAILIDDSFRERRAAGERGVAAFDLDAVELLEDDRA
ncbi:ATP-grasp domain-containing protein [Miltoncostaea marina]|uniref:ATP-grasp domain-containing protein n=1 Tax=Miltoncostaea marina TaxID=2843215 RepID=UPI001C3C9114|nr:ATP-grasp domain-containing protein [Miltoncostaea marina]